jgi:nucleotide-binding universal stress UspA family protein
LRSGWPGTAIESAAQELEVDLIVIATEGWMSLDHPLGNVAQHVVRASKCPVLSFGFRSKITTLNRILCPLDFDSNSAAVLKFAGRLAEDYGATVVLLHVVPVSGEGSEVSPPKPSTSEWEQETRRRLAKMAEENLPPAANCELQVRRGDPAQAILDAETELRTNLIVMATHGRTGLGYVFLGSVALRVVSDSSVPVLTVRPG